MSALVVQDLDHNVDLDQKAMKKILGGFNPVKGAQHEGLNRTLRKTRTQSRGHKYSELTVKA